MKTRRKIKGIVRGESRSPYRSVTPSATLYPLVLRAFQCPAASHESEPLNMDVCGRPASDLWTMTPASGPSADRLPRTQQEFHVTRTNVANYRPRTTRRILVPHTVSPSLMLGELRADESIDRHRISITISNWMYPWYRSLVFVSYYSQQILFEREIERDNNKLREVKLFLDEIFLNFLFSFGRGFKIDSIRSSLIECANWIKIWDRIFLCSNDIYCIAIDSTKWRILKNENWRMKKFVRRNLRV